MIKKLSNFQLVFTVSLSLVLLCSILFLPFTANSQETAECPDFTKNQVIQLKAEFYQNLDQRLSQATPVSTDLSPIYDLYRQLLSDLSDIFQDTSPNVIQDQNVLSDPQAESCRSFIETQKNSIQKTLESVLNKTISQKQSFNLIEKYSQINQQFSNLKTETDQVANKIKTFSQKLPCYSQACVQD